MSLIPCVALPLEERVEKGADFVAQVEYTDLTDAVTSEAQALSFDIAAKEMVECKYMVLDTPFADTSSTANNTTTVTAGDGNGVNTLLTSTELNLNGSYINLKAGTGTRTVYTAADTVDLTFTPKSGTNLAALKQGRARFYFKIIDGRPVAPQRVTLST